MRLYLPIYVLKNLGFASVNRQVLDGNNSLHASQIVHDLRGMQASQIESLRKGLDAASEGTAALRLRLLRKFEGAV